MQWVSGPVLLSLLGLAAALVSSDDAVDAPSAALSHDEVSKRSVQDGLEGGDLELLDEPEDDGMDKRTRLFRYGRGGLMRYGKRAPVFRYGKRAPVFRYGKRDADADYLHQLEEAKRVFRYGKRDSYDGDDDSMEEMKRVFRYGKRSDEAVDDDELEAIKRVFRYGKRAEDYKRRVFRFGKRGGEPYEFGRDSRVPDQPHVPFRFGEE